MKRFVSIVVASFGLSLLVLGGLASCEQGEGERCQVQSDCAAGLTCNVGEHVCRKDVQGDILVDPPVFEPPIDAPIDAIDAM